MSIYDNERDSTMRSLRKSMFGYAFAGAAAVAGVATVVDGIVITRPDQVKMILSAGKIERYAPEGISLKWPVYQSVFDATTSEVEYKTDPANIGFQNGTITAEQVQASIFVRLNGTRAEQEETLRLLRVNMPEFEERIKAYGEKAIRDTIRLSIVESREEGEQQSVTSARPEDGRINIMDSNNVAQIVAGQIQENIDQKIPGTVNVAGEEVPRMEVTQVKLGDFGFDNEYMARRQRIADSRAAAEAARFRRAEAERIAEATIAAARGEKESAIERATGEAESIRLTRAAEADGLRQLVDAAGGDIDNLTEFRLADRWNGETPDVVGGTDVIVDTRYAPGTDVTGVIASKNSGEPTPAPARAAPAPGLQ